MKILSIILSASLLSGCASTVCKQGYAENLELEKDSLTKMKKEIHGYANGKRLPGESGMRVHRNAVIGQLTDNYDKRAVMLNYKYEHFNMVCGE